MNNEIRILILEDNPSDAELVQRELRKSGFDFTIRWAQDQAAFVQALNEFTPDIILADYALPGFDGLAAITMARERFAEIPVVIVSGTIGEENAIETLRAGATDYVLKQRLARLGPVVQRALREAREVAERRRVEDALREELEHKLEFYQRTIMAATDGKLVITDREKIAEMVGTSLAEWEIHSPEDLQTVRHGVEDAARAVGIDKVRLGQLIVAVGEAAMNVVKHAKTGKASVHQTDDSLIVVLSDHGPGIPALALPDVALRQGYSTAGTLGMGYKIMIQFADGVCLATDAQGTCVCIEMKLHPETQPRQLGVQAMAAE